MPETMQHDDSRYDLPNAKKGGRDRLFSLLGVEEAVNSLESPLSEHKWQRLSTLYAPSESWGSDLSGTTLDVASDQQVPLRDPHKSIEKEGPTLVESSKTGLSGLVVTDGELTRSQWIPLPDTNTELPKQRSRIRHLWLCKPKSAAFPEEAPAGDAKTAETEGGSSRKSTAQPQAISDSAELYLPNIGNTEDISYHSLDFRQLVATKTYRDDTSHDEAISADGSYTSQFELESSIVTDITPEFDLIQSALAPFRTKVINILICSFAITQYAGQASGSSNGSSQQRIQGSDVGGTTSSSSSSNLKRSRDSASDKTNDDDDDDGNLQEPSRKKISSKALGGEKLLACPFCKFNPYRYRSCYKYVLKEISRLKQHLSRCHRIPIHCPLCSLTFDAEDNRDDHIRALNCQTGPKKEWEGINKKQRKLLEQRVSARKSKEENWYEIYAILFPDQPFPKSPYLSTMLSADLLRLQDYFLSDGVQVVRDITATILPSSLQPHIEEVQSFLEAAFQDAIQILLERWEAKNRTPSSSEGPPTPPMREQAQNQPCLKSALKLDDTSYAAEDCIEKFLNLENLARDWNSVLPYDTEESNLTTFV